MMHTKVISGFSLIALSGTGARTTACALIGLQKRALRESRGEGYSPSWPTRGGCALKWYLFQASDTERVAILLVEVFQRVGKSVIWVCERAYKG